MPPSQNNSKAKLRSKSTKPSSSNEYDREKKQRREQPRQTKSVEELKTPKDQIDRKSFQEAQKKIIDQFIKNAHWNLLLDLYLLYGLVIMLGIILFIIEGLLGIIFFIFAIICCIIISLNYYNDIKDEIDKVLKDLEVLLKYKS